MSELLNVVELKTYYPIKRGVFSKTVGYVYAVDGISFTLDEGSSLGLVGESGCGKTTAGMSILRLIPTSSGHIYFQGQDLAQVSERGMKDVRQNMQIVFQDPYSSLNPKFKLKDIICEPMIVYNMYTKKERGKMVDELLERVGLSAGFANRFPHELSGGQRQRVGIARVLSLNPKLIVADEPVSALDVSIQAQIINLLEDLQKDFQLSYIIISHDLSVVEHMCDRIAVMYLGRIVELAYYDQLFSSARHPYTKALLNAIPMPDPHANKEKIILRGQVPSPIEPPPGCHFHPRCPDKSEICEREVPVMVEVEQGHQVACHLVK